MPRCSYTHKSFKLHNKDTAYHCDNTERCWVTDVGKFGSEDKPEYYCVFHVPQDREPPGHEGWSHEALESVQAEQLRKLLDEWNAENKQRKDNGEVPLEFVLPGMNCGTIDLSGYIFSGHICFDSANFSGNANFESATFNYAMFDSATFSGDADFESATFSNFSWFESTTFSSEAIFKSATFSSHAVFGSATFSGTTVFESTTFRGTAMFDSATFSGDTHFIDTQFDSTTNFTNCLFSTAPKFHNAKLHQGTDFRGTIFKDITSRGAPPAYRTLKLAMAQVRSREEEGDFFALELESLRHQPDTLFSTKLFSFLYWAFSNYGRSFMRPIWCLLGTTTLFWFIYRIMLAVHVKLTEHYPLFVTQFTVEQIVRPFNVWTQRGAEVISAMVGDNVLLFQVAATVQSLLSISLITLFLLAIRRHFKLG